MVFDKDTSIRDELDDMHSDPCQINPRPNDEFQSVFVTTGDTIDLSESSSSTLYARLGGYDGMTAVVEDLLPRLMRDEQLKRFWKHRSDDGLQRETQLWINLLCHSAGGPVYESGRDMLMSFREMGISGSDWRRFVGHLADTLSHFEVNDADKVQILALVASTKGSIVEIS